MEFHIFKENVLESDSWEHKITLPPVRVHDRVHVHAKILQDNITFSPTLLSTLDSRSGETCVKNPCIIVRYPLCCNLPRKTVHSTKEGLILHELLYLDKTIP